MVSTPFLRTYLIVADCVTTPLCFTSLAWCRAASACMRILLAKSTLLFIQPLTNLYRPTSVRTTNSPAFFSRKKEASFFLFQFLFFLYISITVRKSIKLEILESINTKHLTNVSKYDILNTESKT